MNCSPIKTSARAGLSLLEVVLALAILSASFILLSQLVSTGLRAAANARDLTRAQILAETVISEMVAEVTPPTTLSRSEIEPGWYVSVQMLSTTQDGIVNLHVTVEREVEGRRGVRYELARWIRDPSLPPPIDPLAETESADASSASGSSAEGF